MERAATTRQRLVTEIRSVPLASSTMTWPRSGVNDQRPPVERAGLPLLPAAAWRSVSGQHPGGLYRLQFWRAMPRTFRVEVKGADRGPRSPVSTLPCGHGVANKQRIHRWHVHCDASSLVTRNVDNPRRPGQVEHVAVRERHGLADRRYPEPPCRALYHKNPNSGRTLMGRQPEWGLLI